MTGTGIAAIICLALTLINLASLAIALRRLGRPDPEPAGAAEAPVTIVRPVCGLETYSEETLASGFRLAYPAYELIFCVARAADPIVPLVERLIAANPGVPARLIVGDERVSDNPKLNNCIRGWDAARHDWIVLADSNVLMPPDYIQRLRAAWRPGTGLVCSTPVGTRPGSFWAEVECAFLNTLQARWQYVGEALGLGFAQGKSMLWHRPMLESRGGIRALGAEIAEDAAATKLVRAMGRQVHLVAAPFAQPLGPRRAGEVWSRQLRWARLRRVTFPLFFAPEIGTGAVIPMLAAYPAAGGGLSGLAAMLGTGSVWYGAEWRLAARNGWPRSWRWPLACLARDLLFVPIWLAAWVARDIVWRGNAMDIRTKDLRAKPARLGTDASAA
ncbi:ceramide glucosyltransferase [Methylobacterium platani]|uniref:Ceramide glucosyltransferase n=2 Tax=Methylobacterium platani TaxID=427683 RepID=A0A179S6W0_9HYPH|nr:ceramide glucosyltransferase [Methylobacterium platani]KMO12689.1 ceramide glucosyltransferase [Methylobacterium platani JCM 14648]OAS23129.1 ceramide glucosyltransferase [Methylobacterium platani]